MFGPVSSAAHAAPAGIPALVVGEVLGTFAVYLGLFGKVRGERSGRIVFVTVGGFFIWTFARELHQRPGGDATAVVALIGTVALLAATHLLHWSKFRGSGSWPLISATIESIDVREVNRRSSHCFVAETGYSYRVNGEYFSGRYSCEFSEESEAWRYANSERGRAILIRYNLENPAAARLDTDA